MTLSFKFTVSSALARDEPLLWDVLVTGSAPLSLIFQVVILGTRIVSTMHSRKT